MKSWRPEAFAVGVMFAAVALLLGCGPFTGRPEKVAPQPSTYEELETQAAWGELEGQTTAKEPSSVTPRSEAATGPRKAYSLFRDAIRKRDYESCWRLLSRDTHDAYEREAADLKMRVMNSTTPLPSDLELLHILGLTRKEVDKFTGKMAMKASFQRAAARNPRDFELITRTHFDHETIWGDRAKVFFRVRDTRRMEEMGLVREGSVWRIEATTPVKTLP